MECHSMSINMRSSTHPKVVTFSLKTLSAAVLTALLCSSGYAAGLGKLTVLSSLGQPLRAEIELTSVAKDEAGTIVAKLASAEAYRQANIDFNPALFSLRFAIETRGSRHFIRVTSTQPINEPFVDMLLELGGTNSRLVREYTFLLDPVDLRMGQSAQIAAVPARAASSNQTRQPAVQASPVPQPSAATSSAASSDEAKTAAERAAAVRAAGRAKAGRAAPVADRAVNASAPAPASEQTDGYAVKKGDTLAGIASQVKPEGVSLDQMLVALYRSNTNAFVGKNMNRLRAGQILTVPDAEQAKGISNSDARGVIVAQAADFNAYRNNLAEQVVTAAAPKSTDASQSAAGKITTQVEEKPTAANEAKDKLKLSKAGAAAAQGADGKSTGIAAGTEDLLAKEKALAEANARVKELERNVGDLQKLLEVKNKNLADQQKQAAASAAVAAAIAPAAPAASAPGATAPAAPAAPAATTAPVSPPPASPATGPGAVASDANKPVEVPAPAVAVDKAAQSAPAAEPPVAAVKPQPAPAKAVAPAPAPTETSFLDDVLDNSVLLASLGVGLLAGLAALGFYSMRRRKPAKQFDDSILNDSSLKANSLFGSTGGQSVDTSNSVFNSSFTPAASQLDTNEVDPVAEADVYIAYGRDAQAEEILKEALRTQPERNAVRLKLLEIYANRKDLRAFETLASELYSITKGEGEDWEQAAAMGATLDANNPLYAGTKSSGNAPGKSAALMAPTQPLDESELDDLLTTTQSQSTLASLDGLDANSAYFGNTLVAADVPPQLPDVEPAPKAAPELNKQSANGLDFDLAGLGIQAPTLPPMEEPFKPTFTAVEPADLDIGVLDFNLDDQPATKQATDLNDAPPTAMNVEIGNDDLSFMPADLPHVDDEPTVQQRAGAEPSALNFDLTDISLDLSSFEKKAESDPTHHIPAASAPSLDFANDVPSFDVSESAPAFELPKEDFASHLVTEAEADFSPDSEMATKLDLAIAYQEIGDKDGARELLDEVIKGGNPDQSQKAKSLMVSLA